MKRVIYLFVGILTLVFAASCSESDDPVIVDPATELVEVSFDINNYLPETASKDDLKGDPDVPVCNDGAVADQALLTIDGKDYVLELVTLNGGLETEVVKLAAGAHTVESFVVVDADGDTMYASPLDGSYYAGLWNLIGVTETFTVEKFTKMKVNIDVLCYQPYDYEDFGFAWFQYAKYEVKTICFYGDICTKFFDEFHADGSPYFGQDYAGYDFPAIFDVVIRDENGIAVNDLNKNSNIDWQGTGEPLCIEYPDLIGADENYTFDINLHMPGGDVVTVHTGDLAEGISSDATASGFGGEDGIFDFVVGNCSYDGNDADLELPAWIPFPKEPIKFKISGTPSGSEGYVQAQFDLDGGAAAITTIGELIDGQTYAMWCAEKDAGIGYGTWYTADVYSSLDPDSMPSSISSIPWGKLNWIMNHKDGFSNSQIQAALWYVIHNGVYGSSVAGLTDAAISGWTPTVGDWAILAFDADGYDGRTDVQLMIVRVDP